MPEIETEDIETATVSTKGQIIIPARLRKKFGLQKGRKVIFMEEEGYIKMVPPADLRSLCGSWPDLDVDKITKEIIEEREDDLERERLIEEAIKKSNSKSSKKK